MNVNIVKIVMRIFKMKILSVMKNKKLRSGAKKKKRKNKKKIHTKGKIDVNGFEVIQTIHCSYRLGDFCRS